MCNVNFKLTAEASELETERETDERETQSVHRLVYAEVILYRHETSMRMSTQLPKN